MLSLSYFSMLRSSFPGPKAQTGWTFWINLPASCPVRLCLRINLKCPWQELLHNDNGILFLCNHPLGGLCSSPCRSSRTSSSHSYRIIRVALWCPFVSPLRRSESASHVRTARSPLLVVRVTMVRINKSSESIKQFLFPFCFPECGSGNWSTYHRRARRPRQYKSSLRYTKDGWMKTLTSGMCPHGSRSLLYNHITEQLEKTG